MNTPHPNQQIVEHDIVSVGKACSIVGVPVDRIRLAAQQLGLKIAARIDGREFYARTDIDRIADIVANMTQDDIDAFRRFDRLQ